MKVKYAPRLQNLLSSLTRQQISKIYSKIFTAFNIKPFKNLLRTS
ncbi:hypothetical protein GLIP_2107 [Aliiglaciecola lipolytica E3]|uniref:Uncharacterized protein n=1 Tax=Aliiglaciecola lipolytica E3 TaxID=1127673 RepID=K6YTX8_9ALTE|nr:hypothetical protein GLIP_2107 [Aliiglaciecola lipolytica E3]